MKKTLIAIAALAVVGAASAQVTLYGKIDATAKASTTGKSGAAPVADLTKYSIDSAGLSGSRWGVKGSEDLGGGLTASFQLEQGFSVDTGEASNTRQFHRQAYATLGGGFGSLSLGRQYGTIDNVIGYLDIQGYTSNSAMGSAFAAGAHADGTDGSGRISNSIVYTTPTVSGFTGVVQYAPGEDKTATAAATAYSGFYAMYSAGPLFVMGGYEQRSYQATAAAALVPGTAVAGTVFTLGTAAVAAVPSKTISGGMIGATYDLGAVKLSGSIENGNTSGKSDFGYGIGAAIPMGAAVLQLGWAAETQSADASVDGTSDGLGATLVYTLSKRTNVYGSFLRANSTPAAATAAAQTKTTSTTYGVGVRHDF